MNMKFVKGMILGGIATAGVMYMYNEMPGKEKRQLIRKGKKLVKKIGVI